PLCRRKYNDRACSRRVSHSSHSPRRTGRKKHRQNNGRPHGPPRNPGNDHLLVGETITMRTALLILSLLVVNTVQTDLPLLRVSPDKHFLQTEKGEPFFW